MLALILALLATGGANSIAFAPVVPYGTPETGDMANGEMFSAEQSPNDCPEYHSLWTIKATQGDRIRIDWHSEMADVKMQVFDRGTTDADLLTAAPIVTSTLDNTRGAVAIFRPTRSGRYPLDFYTIDCAGVSDDPAPYDFTATVQRRVRLALSQHRKKLDRSGTIRVGVKPVRASVRVSLQFSTPRGHFQTIGSARSRGGHASVAYTVPAGLRGHRGRLRAVARGTGFVPAVSAERFVTAAR